jgi:hypothetical protein
MTGTVKILVSKIEADKSIARSSLVVTTKISAPPLDFELEFRVANTGNIQNDLEEVRNRLVDLGNGIAEAASNRLAL